MQRACSTASPSRTSRRRPTSTARRPTDGPRAVHRRRRSRPKPSPKPTPKHQADADADSPRRPRPRRRRRRRPDANPGAGDDGGGNGGGPRQPRAGGPRPARPRAADAEPWTARAERRRRARRATDPLARSMSEGIGGPLGRHARAAPLVDAGPGAARAVRGGRSRSAMVQHEPCLHDQLGQRPGPLRQDVLLRRALPLHRARLRRGAAGPTPTTGGRYQAMEYPVGDRLLRLGAPPRSPRSTRRRRRSRERAPRRTRTSSVVAARDDRGGQHLLPGHRGRCWRAFGLLAAWFLAGVHRAGPGTRCRSCSHPRCC